MSWRNGETNDGGLGSLSDRARAFEQHRRGSLLLAGVDSVKCLDETRPRYAPEIFLEGLASVQFFHGEVTPSKKPG
jgi:hypothetical protein